MSGDWESVSVDGEGQQQLLQRHLQPGLTVLVADR